MSSYSKARIRGID